MSDTHIDEVAGVVASFTKILGKDLTRVEHDAVVKVAAASLASLCHLWGLQPYAVQQRVEVLEAIATRSPQAAVH